MGPKDVDCENLLKEVGMDEDELSSSGILVDNWGNEWDSTDEFGDMDFRLVDE